MAQQTDLAESQAVERIRRPKNAFILYSNENRRRVKEINKGVDNRGISKILGTQWKQLRRSEQFTYWRRSVEERRDHRLANPGYVYSPVAARKRKEELKRLRKVRRGLITEETNVIESVIRNKSQIQVWKAEGVPSNRMFRPLFQIYSDSPSVQTPTNDSSDIRFLDLLSLLKSKNNIQVNDQMFSRIRTTCTPVNNDWDGNKVQNAMTGRDGALPIAFSGGTSNQAIDTRSQSDVQSVNGFFQRGIN